MNRTTIEWVRNPDGTPGYSWNPITGCLNGCPYCYARKIATSRVKTKYLANTYTAAHTQMDGLAVDMLQRQVKAELDAFYPRLWKEKLIANKSNPLGRRKPAGIFVCDMGDLFGIMVPEEWTRLVRAHMVQCPQHRFYLLTKQPQNLLKYGRFPDNCWVGITLTGTEDTVFERLDYLYQTKARTKYISIEPLLASFNATNLLSYMESDESMKWLIIGAQTKPDLQPAQNWIKDIVAVADRAGVPVFLKNNLRKYLPRRLGSSPDFTIYHKPVHGGWKLRQDMPIEEAVNVG